jgi:hypothetical protein
MSKALKVLKRGLQKPKDLIAKSSFSSRELLVFALVFFGIGAYVLYRSFAAGPLVASLEAEQMSLPVNGSVITDTAASGGKALQLLSNGTASGSVSLPSNATDLTVLARGDQCGGSPTMSVAVDGVNVITTAVASTAWTSYSATKALGTGSHSVSITFSGDYVKTKGKRSCDRNLYVDVTNLFGPVAAPTPAPTVALSASPTSLTAGQAATLTWNSTDASSCTASGAWSGAQPTSGSTSTGALNTNSTYTLTCTGAGGAGSASVVVSVAGITSNLTNGQSLSGSVQWIVTPVGSTSITKVDYYIDGALKWTENAAPYYYNGDNNSLDTTTLTNGNHNLMAKATLADATTTSSSVSVGVSNTTTAPPTGSTLFNGDFETGSFSQWDGKYCTFSWSCTVVAAPGGHSGYAGRFESKAGDSGPLGTCCSWNEVQKNSAEANGVESWWHLELYLPADFVDSDSGWQVFAEWHDYPCGCTTSPPVTVQEKAGRFFIGVTNHAYPSNEWTGFDLGTAPRGAWTSFDFHFKWSDNPSIAVEDVSVNGVQKQHVTGLPNEYTGYYNYFLSGWYHHTTSVGQVIYLDNVRRTTY